jgi:hypothetical protein
MNDKTDSSDRRQHKRFQAQFRLKQVKLIKEVDDQGSIQRYTVDIDKGGFSVKKSFDDVESATLYIQQLAEAAEACNERRHNRICSINIISYECLNDNQEVVAQGVGRTLNVSMGGLLLETYLPLNEDCRLSLTIDMHDDLVMDLKARVVYCRDRGNGKYESGIEFLESNEVINQEVRKHIESLKNQIDAEDINK